MGSFKRFGRLDSSHFLKQKNMGRLKEFLIQEQMRITGNWREKDHAEYLAWKKNIEQQEHVYYERRVEISGRDKQRNSKKDLG